MHKKLLEEMNKCSMVAYLWGSTDFREFTTTKELQASTRGSFIRDTFVECAVGSAKLPVGTKGIVFETKKIHYSDYRMIGDMQYPADGATITHVASSFTFLTLVEKSGREILAHAFEFVKFDKPRFLGTI